MGYSSFISGIRRYLIASMLMLVSATVFGQLKAIFDVSVKQGCSPLQVDFINNSTGNPTSFTWKVTGFQPYTVPNPSATLTNGGKYSVTLIVSDGVNFDSTTVTDLITVFPKPEVDFSAPNTGCVPFTTTFTPIISAGNNIVDYVWTLGNRTSNQASPTNNYDAAQQYPISLQVTDDKGCKNSVLKLNYITVKPQPKNTFSASSVKACNPPLSADFTADETDPSYSYSWNVEGQGAFNGNPLTGINFGTAGKYDVTLTITDGASCTSTLTKSDFIVIEKPVASFTPPVRLCANQAATFTNTSTGGGTYQWNFSHSPGSTGYSPSHTYTDSGTYKVSLKVVSADGLCADSTFTFVTVQRPIADFSPKKFYGCQPPESVTFTNLSRSASTYNWFFSNGQSNDYSPTQSFGNGSYNITLEAISSNGCKSTAVGTVVVRKMIPDFNFDPAAGGCIPLDVKFTDASVSDSTITNWDWDFGDGQTGTGKNPTHKYTTHGDMQVKLTITNKLGCKETITKTVLVGKKPTIGYFSDRTIACAGDTIFYTDTSKVDGNASLVDYWRWTFSSHGVIEQTNQFGSRNPFFEDAVDTGYFNLELIVGYNGCLDTLNKTNVEYRQGPVIEQLTSPQICSGSDVLMSMEAANYTTFKWSYGDGSIDTVVYPGAKKVVYPPDSSYVDSLDHDIANPNLFTKLHHYPGPGNYKVKINSYKAGPGYSCTFLDSITVVVPDLKAEISYTDSICFNTASLQFAVNFGKATTFEWFVDGIRTGSGIAHDITSTQFPSGGSHEIKLVVKDSAGCSDTARVTLHILKPQPVILSANPLSGCSPLRVSYQGGDNSGVPVGTWMWNFGSAVPPNSFDQNPDTVYYNTPGNYPVTLTVTDVYNCKSSVSLTTPISVTNPVSDFDLVKSVLCLGDSIKVVNKSAPSSVNSRWYLSTGESSNLKNPVFPTDTFGNIYVTLITDIGGGCYDTLTKTVVVEPRPTVNFEVLGDSVTNCYPVVGVLFESTITPTGFNGYQYAWDFGEGSISANDTGSASYFEPGEYDIKLVVTTPLGGCKDSLIKVDYIKVRGPSADFAVSDTNVCVKDLITYYISNKDNVESFYWDFGDGVITPGTDDSIQHFYTLTGYRSPILVIQAGDCKVPIIKSIFVNDVVARFSLPDFPDFKIGEDTLKGCGTFDLEAKFLNTASGNIDEFYWDLDLGMGLNDSDTTVTATYQIGTKQFFLAVSDFASGCKDTIFQKIIVYPLAVADAGPDQILCQGDSALLHGTGGITYEWTPAGAGLNRTDVADVVANPPNTTEYTLKVVDINGCEDTNKVTISRDKTSIDFGLAKKTDCGSITVAPALQATGTYFEWLFDNSIPFIGTNPVQVFTVPGKHYIEVKGYELDPKCTKIKRDTVEVFPLPFIALPGDQVLCEGDTFLINGAISGIPPVTISWSPTAGLSNPNIATPFAYPTDSTNYVVTVTDKNCSLKDSIVINVDHTKVDFSLATTDTCYQLPLVITNNSIGTSFLWEFTSNPLDNSGARNPVFTYTTPGTYTVRLTVVDKDVRCKQTATQTVTIHPAPPVKATGTGFMCNYDSLFFRATGARDYVWTPSIDLSDPLKPSTWCYADTNRRYFVTGTDENNCSFTDSVDVTVQPDYTIPHLPNDTIVIGEIVSYDLTANGSNISYSWSPSEFLDCTNCPGVTIQPLHDICYHINFSDDKGCYPKFTDFCVIVVEKYTVDVPNAFTPNADGRNDKIYVKGFGIKKLLNFTIYNRWGEVVFETSDINVGWDGVYKDKLQNDETYAFTVNAETWSGKVMTRNGYITLLK